MQRQGGGCSFQELMEVVGTVDVEEAKALRQIKRSSGVVAEVVDGVNIQPMLATARKRSRITALPPAKT